MQRTLHRIRPFLVEEVIALLERIAQGFTGNCEKLVVFHMQEVTKMESLLRAKERTISEQSERITRVLKAQEDEQRNFASFLQRHSSIEKMIGEYERYGQLDYKKFDPKALEKFASGVTEKLITFSKYI